MIDKNKMLNQLLNINDEKLIEEFISAYFKYKENLINFSSPNLSKHKNFEFSICSPRGVAARLGV